jgi:hypothetical protein
LSSPPRIASSDVLTPSTVFRGVTYTATGALIGWFAQDNRTLVEQLRVLAERDFLTGLPNTRARGLPTRARRLTAAPR